MCLVGSMVSAKLEARPGTSLAAAPWAALTVWTNDLSGVSRNTSSVKDLPLLS